MYKLFYIGKSNKKFTHNHLYNFMGSTSLIYKDINITIYANRNRLIYFNNNHFDYLHENFKLLDDNEIKQLERKFKLKKINENTTS
jgi:hypothetical protein